MSREVSPRAPLLTKLAARCPFDFSATDFQQALVDRVLHDPQQQRYPPNRYQAAYFWRDLVAKIREKIAAAASTSASVEIHPALAEREKDALALADANEEEDLRAGFYRNFELASVCDATTTSRLGGETDSVLVLPSCPADRSHLYPFRVETGNMAASIGLVQWPAGFLMCEFALDYPEIFAGKRVLELGAGIGLTSTILARHTRPAAIVATDFDVRALENIHNNFTSSQPHTRIPQTCPWRRSRSPAIA